MPGIMLKASHIFSFDAQASEKVLPESLLVHTAAYCDLGKGFFSGLMN